MNSSLIIIIKFIVHQSSIRIKSKTSFPYLLQKIPFSMDAPGALNHTRYFTTNKNIKSKN